MIVPAFDGAPSIKQIQTARDRLGDLILETPVIPWKGVEITRLLGSKSEIFLKLELLQHANSFKIRGALTVALNQTPSALAHGLTAMSSGNHAIAVAYVAKVLNTSAKVVMQATANSLRRTMCERLGGNIVLSATGEEGFELVKKIVSEEGRVFIHPFEGPLTTLGAATIGLELSKQVDRLDAVVVAVGGGGLCSGVGPAIKQLQPACKVYAVEPEGAATMFRSFKSGHTERQERIETIADSLGPPGTEPYSLAMCQQSVDELVLISDQDMRNAMALLLDEMKLVVEPAGAAAAAGICGPLRNRLRGKRVAAIVCGSNIDLDSYMGHVRLAQPFT